MVDVFVVAILVALIHLTGLLVILPGPAAVAFAGVVVSTILAAHAFDTRLIWDRMKEDND
jgi:paraquat-inducible protein A